ncbi:hypothetical protein HHI36_016270 [Cryptolaemus montrouzieri]|uniref:Uncharacterized protein n=1 Tax=Cryptolaemus montrouzieri TaxID=559131 RepID=A0ABD2NK02_9CUCU
MNHSKKNKDTQLDIDRAHSSMDVSRRDSYLNLSIRPRSPTLSTFTLTPGKSKNINEDMEILRISRQDNPFIQQVIASRESIIDSLELESDHVNLMAKDLVLDIDVDPLTLPEVHEHMIRSPPPTMWPKSGNLSVFHFPNGEDETLLIEVNGLS